MLTKVSMTIYHAPMCQWLDPLVLLRAFATECRSLRFSIAEHATR